MPLVQKPFGDVITFTRASTATFFDSTGTLQSAAINVPRLDYDPATLLPRGFLVEEQRTNSIRNNTMQGAVAGTPGTTPTNWVQNVIAAGLNRTIVGTGVTNGITWIDIQFQGTTTNANGFGLIFESSTGVAATSGQTWTGSSFFAIAAGSAANITNINSRITERDAGGAALVASDTSITVTSSLSRFTQTRTLTNASTAFIASGFSLTIPSGAAIDITLRIGLPQLELGAFATSVIPTTTTALTRSADVAAVNTLSPWFNGTEGTLFGEYQTLSAGTTQFVAAITSVSESDRITIGQTTTTYVGAVVDTGAVQASITQGATSTNISKIALAYLVNNFAFTANSGSPGTDATGTVPGNLTEMKLGRRGVSTSPLNGHLRRITYYPRKLSLAELQAITA